MIKTIFTESDKEIKLSNAAAFLYVYKNQFGKEPLKDIAELTKAFQNQEEELDQMELMKRFDLEVLYNLAWSLAKTADRKTEEPMDFYLKYDDFKPLDHALDIINLAVSSLTGSFEVEDSKEQSEKN